MRAATKFAIGVVCAVAAGAVLISRLPQVVPSSGYFDQPSSVALSGLGSNGERFYVGLAQLEVRQGDRVQLIALDGVPPTAEPVVARLRDTSSAIGVLQADQMDHLDAYKSLRGATMTAEDGPFQVLVVIAASGVDLSLSGPVLRFSINDGDAQAQRLLVNVLLCAHEAHPDTQCPTPEPPAA